MSNELKEFSAPYMKTFDEKTLIALINSKGVYGECTKRRAMTALSTLDNNFKRTGHLIKLESESK